MKVEELVQITSSPVSKSLARAMGCEYYYRHQYMSPDRSALDRQSAMSQAGNEFHEYRAAYIDHLVKVDSFHDPQWVEEWLKTHELLPRTVQLIERDAAKWAVNPQTIYGTELFLSIDANFELLENETGRQPGSVSSHARAHASGQIDLLKLEGEYATIVDAKTGFSVQNITEEEAAIYSCLVFAHFPQVNVIEFNWDFVGRGLSKTSVYSREDLPALKAMVNALVKNRARVDALPTDELKTNPWVGMCPYCRLDCPVRRGADQVDAIMPLQTLKDAQRLAGIVYVCQEFLKKARPELKDFLAARGEDFEEGQMPIADEFILESTTATSREYDVYSTLGALGLAVVDVNNLEEEERALILSQQPKVSPKYDVTMSKLRIGSTALNSYAKAKKRAGLSRDLDAIATISAGATTLRFRKANREISEPEDAAE